ncbi:MAG: gamma carbonic anhydrase family protein, partial [Deltaproteobacteria bacterium]|nr:gamma carbonic anhydrase family protein [Deltaproteobacteria bacterium]
MIMPYESTVPLIDSSVFVADNATIIGDVTIGEDSSVWFNVVVRGDVNNIRIGDRSNIQDGSIVHVTHQKHPTRIGDDVTVGHSVTLHGCTVGNACLIGIGSILLDGVEVGDCSLVAAGSLVVPGSQIPPGSLVMGQPAKVVRPLTQLEQEDVLRHAENYVGYARKYL